MTLLWSDYLLLFYVVAGLIVATLLGAGIGSTGLTLALDRAWKAERDAAQALGQLALAKAALRAATHPVQHTDDRPETDAGTDALVRAVTGPSGRALPTRPEIVAQGDAEAWVWGEQE